jgi:hypothetical protein
MAQNFPGGHELLNGTCAGLPLRGTLLIGASIEIHYAGSAEEGEIALQFIELFSGQALVSFAEVGTPWHQREDSSSFAIYSLWRM